MQWRVTGKWEKTRGCVGGMLLLEFPGINLCCILWATVDNTFLLFKDPLHQQPPGEAWQKCLRCSPHGFIWDLYQIMCDVATAAAKLLQSCLTLCDPIDGSPPGSPIPGILQARTLEGVAISFSNAWKWKVEVKLLSRVRLLATPWTAAYQAPPSMGFSRQEYWSGMPLPSLTESAGKPQIYQTC